MRRITDDWRFWLLVLIVGAQQFQNWIDGAQIKELQITQQKLIDMVCYLEGGCPEPTWESFYE